jgi:rhomboid family GlyGly-CTERM serine protease
MALAADQSRFSLRPISLIVAVSIVAMTAFQAMPVPWRNAIRYDRAAIGTGETWRLVTGHFVHLGWGHLALNMAGLALGTWLFGADRSPVQWVTATILSAVACGAGLWLFSPSVGWCVGLSGVLHGLMVVGFGGWMLAGDRWAAGLLAIVVAKMTWEQIGGGMPWESALAGGPVITDAHVWGATGGALFLAGDSVWKRLRAQV